jgi:hypothetical protein
MKVGAKIGMLSERVGATTVGADGLVFRDAATCSLVSQSPAASALLESRSGFKALRSDSLAKEGRRRADERRDGFPIRINEAEEDGGMSSEEVNIFLQPARGGEKGDAGADRVGFQFPADVLFRGKVAIFIPDDRDRIQEDLDGAFLWGEKARWERICEDFPEVKYCFHGRGTVMD